MNYLIKEKQDVLALSASLLYDKKLETQEQLSQYPDLPDLQKLVDYLQYAFEVIQEMRRELDGKSIITLQENENEIT